MDRTSNGLISRYAKAFWHSYNAAIYDTQINQLSHAIALLESKKECLFLVNRVCSLSTKPEQLFTFIIEQYQLPAIIEPLLRLLVHHKRVYLLADIVQMLIDLYYEQKGIVRFTIASNPELTTDEQKQIEHFISKQFGTGHSYYYTHNPALIAGIQIQSATTYWEYSCSRQLNEMAILLIS